MNAVAARRWIPPDGLSLRAALSLICGILLWGAAGSAAQKTFSIGGANVTLEEASSEIEVRFRSMRLNRALNVWNAELSLTNKSARTFSGPFLVLFDSFTNTTGVSGADGVDDSVPAKPFYDLSGRVLNGRLVSGQVSGEKTITLLTGNGAPRVITRVFAAPDRTLALGLTRTLDDAGLPLPGVEIAESAPSGNRAFAADAAFATATLGQERGEHTWRFSAPGFLPVWRRQVLGAEAVANVPNPRLTARSSNTRILQGNTAGFISNLTERIDFPAAAIPVGQSATLTPLTFQALPAFLPAGWSPLQAFWLELENEPAAPGTADLKLAAPLGISDRAAFVRWDTNAFAWRIVQTLSTNGTDARVTVPGAGAYLVVAGDSAPAAVPPLPQAGQLLLPSTPTAVSPADVRAEGTVEPSMSVASRFASEVTGTARVTITNVNGALSSGFLLRGEIEEDYVLQNGSHHKTAPYETFITGYQRPGTGPALHASFPLRPQLLLGAEDLFKAVVKADVLLPSNFSGTIADTNGTQLPVDGSVRLIIAGGDVPLAEAAIVRSLSAVDFSGLTEGSSNLLNGFELTIGTLTAGRRVGLQIDGLSANGNFVLGRVVSQQGIFGLEPVERFVTGTNGSLVSVEPVSGSRLPGIAGSGQYFLVRVPGPQALLTGVARNAGGNPQAGLVVRILNQPWVTFSATDGSYKLISSIGTASVTVLNTATGDSGFQIINLASGGGSVDLLAASAGPRVESVDPAGGSTGVPRVSPVLVRFNEPINPGTLGLDGIQLLDTNGLPVAASLTLNLRNTIATMLPVSPLAPSARFTIRISTNLADLTAMKLEGPNEFTFTTASDNLNRGPAQVQSFEPVNGFSIMIGSAGIAEPDSPVILVNETSGRTTTVLSKSDGSFSNSISANIDDYLSAVIVNQNGTRNTIPVSRQILRDGSVGLFKGGGILEAQSDGGPVQVLVEPGAITTKSVFKLETVSIAQLLEVVSNTPPQNSQLVGGFKFSAEGDSLKKGAAVSFPVNVNDLHLPPDVAPTNQAFALCRPVQVEGQTVYEVLDTMQYVDGNVVTHSYPFDGLMDLPGGSAVIAVVMLPYTLDRRLVVIGTVVLASESVARTLTSDGIQEAVRSGDARVRLLPGAQVSAFPPSGGLSTRPGLQPGVFVARANSAGFYRLLVPFNPFQGGGALLIAQSPRVPNLFGTKTVSQPPGVPLAVVDMIIARPDTPSGNVDTFAPIISLTQPSAILATNQDVTIEFLLRDDLSHPRLDDFTFDPEHSVTVAGDPFSRTNIGSIFLGQPVELNGTTARVPVTFRVNAPGLVSFRVLAADEVLNQREMVFNFRFGAPPSDLPGPIPASDPNDRTRPQVLSASPGEGSLLATADKITIRFSEAVRPSITNGLGVGISGGAQVRVLLSGDQQTATLIPSSLQPGQDYTVTLTSEIRDINGNSLDQNAATPAFDPFVLTFKTPPLVQLPLSGVPNPVSTVVYGSYAFSLERGTKEGSGSLKVHRLRAQDQALFNLTISPTPRAMALIPSYSFRRTPSSPVETKPLLAIVGGSQGDNQIGQWMRIIDISNPEEPVSIAYGLISTDPTIVAANVKFGAPRLAVQLITPSGGLIQYISLQGFILGANYPVADFALHYQAGTDLNGDGDYTDFGDILPVPQRLGIFGLETVVPSADRDMTDFDIAGGGAFLVATMMNTSNAPARFQVMTFQGLSVGSGDDAVGSFEFPVARPFRTVLDLDFPLPGPGGIGVRSAPVALVSAEDLLYLFDLTDPSNPTLAGTLKLGDSGTIFVIRRTGANEYAIGAAKGVFLLRRSEMAIPYGIAGAHPSVAQVINLPVVGRSIGINDEFITTIAGQLRVGIRPPRIRVVQFPGNAVTSIASLAIQDEAAKHAFLDAAQEGAFVLPALISPIGTASPSAIRPADPRFHHYVMIGAPGDLGPEIKVSLESLDIGGKLLPAKGPLFPPVILTDRAADLGLLAAQGPSAALTAHRLSEDAGSDLFNVYLTDPFVLVREPLLPADLTDLAAISGRTALWSGYFLRVSLDAGDGGVFADFQSKVVNGVFHSGLGRVYSALPGEYIDTPNPSTAAAPRLAGVDLQSGEFRTVAVDLASKGRRQDLSFIRTYESRSRYVGPLGRGWDFNWNCRLLEFPAELPLGLCLTFYNHPALDLVVRAGDIQLTDGKGNVMVFRKISASNNNLSEQPGYADDPAIATFGWTNQIAGFYQSPPGEFSVLYKFKDGSYVVVAPNGARTCFQANGRLDRIVDAFPASVLACVYRPDGRLDRVTGDRGNEFVFGYYDAGSGPREEADEYAPPGTISGLIRRVRVVEQGSVRNEVLFDYDSQANLLKAHSHSGSDTLYGYDSQRPYQLTRIGRGDGAQFPAETITYANGLVSKVAQDGREIVFAGAKEKAEERFAEAAGSLSVQFGLNAPVNLQVDNRARPTRFANRTHAADDAGRLTKVSDASVTADILFDLTNAVYRFRGNLVGTRQTDHSGFATTNVFDGSAWNRLSRITSAEGVTSTFSYQDNGSYPDSVQFSTGPVTWTHQLNAFGQTLSEVTQADGFEQTTLFLYDSTGLPIGEQRGDLGTATVTYGTNGVIALQQGPLAFDFSYNADSQLESIQPSAPATAGLRVDYTNGIAASDFVGEGDFGVSHEYVYDGAETKRVGSIISRESGLAQTRIDYLYDPQGRLTSYTENGEQTTLAYDGVLLTGLRGPGSSRQVAYSGNLPVRVTEQGVTALFSYDDQQRLSSLVLQGATNLFDFNAGEQLRSKRILDRSGTLLDESYQYDAAGRIVQVNSDAGNRRYEYFPDGVTRRMFVDDVLIKEIQRDSSGQLNLLRLPGLIEYHYSNPDPAVRLHRTQELRLFPTSGGGVSYIPYQKQLTYDEQGRVKSITWPAGVWSFGYDAFGNVTNRTDPDGVSRQFRFSPGGLLLSTLFTDGTSVQYEYDGNRRLQRIGELTFDLDPQEKLLRQIHYPDGSSTLIGARNAFFEPVSEDRNGIQQLFNWTEGRLTGIHATEDIDYVYDGLGRLTSVKRGNYTTRFDYDEQGQLSQETASSTLSGIPERQWSASFNHRLQLQTEDYPSGLSLDWSPLTNGLPGMATDAGIDAIEWLGPGLLSAVTYSGGLRAVHLYDNSLREFSIHYVTGPPANPTNVAGFDYVLTPAGRILSEERLHEGRGDYYRRNGNLAGMRVTDFYFSVTNLTNGAGALAGVGGISFDPKGELVSPTNTFGSDARGLMPAVTTLNSRMLTADGVAVTYNPQGAVSQVPVWIRLPGETNLTRETATLAYDDFGLVREVRRGTGTNEVVVTYTRDGMGRLLQREVAGRPERCRPGIRQYVWRGSQLIEEYDWVAGEYELVHRYVYLGHRLVLVQAASTPGTDPDDFVPLLNINGSVSGYATPSGELREVIQYGPYGTPVIRRVAGGQMIELARSGVAQTLLFQGEFYDEETGLYQLGQRNLHPQLGRFLQRDSELYSTSQALFAAFNGDPVGMVDPSGALPESIELLKDRKEKLDDLHEKAAGLAEALEATTTDALRKDSALGKAGLEFTASAFELAGTFGGEDFKEFTKNTTAGINHLKQGVDLFQTFLDMRRDRLILTAIKARAFAPQNFSPRVQWIAVGGAGSGYDALDANFYKEEAVEKAFAMKGGSVEAKRFARKFEREYYTQREGNLLQAAKLGHSLAKAYFNWAFKDDHSRKVEVSRAILDVSGKLIEFGGKVRSVSKINDISLANYGIGEAGALEAAGNLWTAAAALKVSFDAGMFVGQTAILQLSDPIVAKAYKEAVEQFHRDGGFLTVSSGILSEMGAYRVAYGIQRFHDAAYLQSFIEGFTKPDERIEFYTRGLEAP